MLIFITFITLINAETCQCNTGICNAQTCYCPYPFAGEHCDYILKLGYGMNYTTEFDHYIGHDRIKEDNDCKSDCNKQGLCIQSQCYCKSPYGGQYCQFKLIFVDESENNSTQIQTLDNLFNIHMDLQTSKNIMTQIKQFDKREMYKKCPVPCRNGGYCVFGQCMCKSPYVGDYCQFQIEFEQGMPHYQVYMLMIFSCFVGIAITVILFMILKFIEDEKKKYELISGENKDQWQRK
ncbi:unnamed protein product [Paramecium octaurelia]|uniref:EGF-like domain-containing protein n=1 Tax=Paramecium octaurelia TaxID=43137 RepID=A0A8S1UDT4_PAROT|nr:unnamed protein product [Paramecium octaurelia]